jgi:phenylalanyl-tRNA synthetase beta chain
MRAPLSWIKEFVDIPASVTAEQISDGLIRVGFEVEEIIKQGADLTGPLKFAKVLSIEEITEFKKPILAKVKPVMSFAELLTLLWGI